MPLTDAQKRANKKWNTENIPLKYDRTTLVLPKGSLAIVRTHATARSESMNAFICRAIEETIRRDMQDFSFLDI